MGSKPSKSSLTQGLPVFRVSKSLDFFTDPCFGQGQFVSTTEATPPVFDWSISRTYTFTGNSAAVLQPSHSLLSNQLNTLRAATCSANQPLRTSLLVFVLLIVAEDPKIALEQLTHFPYFRIESSEIKEFKWVCELWEEIEREVSRQIEESKTNGAKMEPLARQLMAESRNVGERCIKEIQKFRELGEILSEKGRSDREFLTEFQHGEGPKLLL